MPKPRPAIWDATHIRSVVCSRTVRSNFILRHRTCTMATARADTPARSNEYPIPHRMKAWVLGGPEDLSLIEKPVPEPGPAEVLVRVDAIAVCATDSRKRLLARSALPHAAGRTAPVRAVVFTCAERFRPFQEAGNPRLA